MSSQPVRGVDSMKQPMADAPQGADQRARAPKKPYTPPRLQCYGDVRDLTLGQSTGFGESTGAGIRKGGPGS